MFFANFNTRSLSLQLGDPDKGPDSLQVAVAIATAMVNHVISYYVIAEFFVIMLKLCPVQNHSIMLDFMLA